MALTARDLTPLALTIGLARNLIDTGADTRSWHALTEAVVAEHTPDELAELLVAACTIIARTTNTSKAPVL